MNLLFCGTVKQNELKINIYKIDYQVFNRFYVDLKFKQ